MKLRIITGRAGAGKSKLVLETIAAQRFERPQILLVPEHATHEAVVIRWATLLPK